MTTVSHAFTLTGTSIIEGLGGSNLPLTVTLTSSDATRKIELSTDNRLSWFIPQYDIIGTTSLVLYLSGPVTDIRATGIANDVLTLAY